MPVGLLEAVKLDAVEEVLTDIAEREAAAGGRFGVHLEHSTDRRLGELLPQSFPHEHGCRIGTMAVSGNCGA